MEICRRGALAICFLFMGRTFTRDEVLKLAPDAGSAKNGQELAQLRKWQTLQGDEVAIWGQCQGSGAKPYQVQVELGEPAFKCSCPSRKFPCKHGLALLLIFASSPEAIVRAVRPAWVEEWLSSRKARADKAAEKQTRESSPPDPATQAKRRRQRIQKVQAGVNDLSSWIQDLARAGIGTIPGRGYDFFDSQSRRLVDAQAPGVARWVRQLGSFASQGAGWQRPFFEHLSLLHLLTRAVSRLDEIPDQMQSDVESVVGLTRTAEELDRLPAVADQWHAIAQETELDDRLRVQRTWLFGRRTKRASLVLQFAHGARPFEANVPAGVSFEGEIVFFPGNGLRSATRKIESSIEPLTSFNGLGFNSLESLLDVFSRSLADFSWLERLCLPVSNVVPIKTDDRWWIADSSGEELPLKVRDDVGFTLLAVSGGQPVDVALELDGRMARPLAVLADERWLSLCSTLVEVA